MDLETTIVAISSSQGRGIKTLVRASGENVFDSAKKMGLNISIQNVTAGTLNLDNYLLPVLVGAFDSSSSYTGQNVIEIQIPANQTLINWVTKNIIHIMDGRFAEAGEFTARAFFNGKISLTSAEGVCAIISANNKSALRGASLLRQGALATVVEPISETIASALTLVEAGIDFTEEEDVTAITEENLYKVISRSIVKIDEILSETISMEVLQAIPRIVIAGLPNAGKSTLFNALLGRERVTVSSEAGTTRDAIMEPMFFEGKETMLIDIAGTENSYKGVSAMAQVVGKKAIYSADIVLFCVAPGQSGPPDKERQIVVHTKGDLPSAKYNAVSALSKKGLKSLVKKIAMTLDNCQPRQSDSLAILPRHKMYLEESRTHLKQSIKDIKTPELNAASLRLSLDAIGSITGQVSSDQILGEVFSTFCIGK